MTEAQKQQRPLSEVVHQLLADRLAHAGTPEAQAAWIGLATWMRDRIEELLHRYPYPQPQYFDGLWRGIEARPEMTVLASQSNELRAAFNTVRARIFKQQISVGHVAPITEHVTLGNPGAEHDLEQARALLPSDPDEARRLAISAFDKTTAAGETISAENADLAWRLAYIFSDLGDGDYMQRAYTRAWNIYVDLLPTVEDLDLLITMSARATVLKAIFKEADLLIAVIKKRIEKENSVDTLLKIAEDPELMDDAPLRRKTVEKALECASDYEACLRVGKAAEEQFHFPDIAINAYQKAADYVRNNPEKLIGLINRLRGLGAHTIANLVEDILRVLVPPIPTLFPPLRFNTVMIPRGQEVILIQGAALPVQGLRIQEMRIQKRGGRGAWDVLPAGDAEDTFKGYLGKGDYGIMAIYAKGDSPRHSETLTLHVVKEEDFPNSDRVARPQFKSIRSTAKGLLRVTFKLDHEFRPERTRALKSSSDGGTTWQDLLYRAHEGEVEITVDPGHRFCLRAIGDVYAEADSEILEMPIVFSLFSPAIITPAPGQTRVPVDFAVHGRQPTDELQYSLDGGKNWTDYLQPGEHIHLEAPVPAIVQLRCRNDHEPLRNQWSPPIEIKSPPPPPVELPRPAPAPVTPQPSDEVATEDVERAFLNSPVGTHMDPEQRLAEDLIDDDDDWGDLVDPPKKKK